MPGYAGQTRESSRSNHHSSASSSRRGASAVRGASSTVQRQEVEPSSQAAPTAAVNDTGLPDGLRAGVERLSGFSMADVKVHYNSSKPAQLNAYALAQGADIHLGPGQEKHLPHEAWHVVQQKQGRVRPTMQMKGVGVNDDVGLEREADVMGIKATRLGSSEIESSIFTEDRVLGERPSLGMTGRGDSPVQRIHVHMSGSGVEAGEEANGKKFGELYASSSENPRRTHIVSGPGRGVEGTHLDELYLGAGTNQAYRGQDERILNAIRQIGAAWLEGDHEIVLTGFSRGGANAIEVARFIDIYGLINSRNQPIEGTRGARVKFLGLLDPVPVESLMYRSFSHGTARRLTGVSLSRSFEPSIDSSTGITKTTLPKPDEVFLDSEVVAYEDLDIPSNVQYVQSVLAHGETRGSFESYRVKVADPDTTRVGRDVIPFAVHSQVGGTFYGGVEGKGALLAFDALLRGAQEAGVDFGELTLMNQEDRADYVESLFSEPRAAEDFATRLLVDIKPVMRYFDRGEVGHIGEEFLGQLESRRSDQLFDPVFRQFGDQGDFATGPVSSPRMYLDDLTGSRSGGYHPRSGSAGDFFPTFLLLMFFFNLLFGRRTRHSTGHSTPHRTEPGSAIVRSNKKPGRKRGRRG